MSDENEVLSNDPSAHIENLTRMKDALKQENADLRQQLAEAQADCKTGAGALRLCSQEKVDLRQQLAASREREAAGQARERELPGKLRYAAGVIQNHVTRNRPARWALAVKTHKEGLFRLRDWLDRKAAEIESGGTAATGAALADVRETGAQEYQAHSVHWLQDFAVMLGGTPEREASGGPVHAVRLAAEGLSGLSLADFEENRTLAEDYEIELARALYCDVCGEELQRESCDHVRQCVPCRIKDAAEARRFGRDAMLAPMECGHPRACEVVVDDMDGGNAYCLWCEFGAAMREALAEARRAGAESAAAECDTLARVAENTDSWECQKVRVETARLLAQRIRALNTRGSTDVKTG